MHQLLPKFPGVTLSSSQKKSRLSQTTSPLKLLILDQLITEESGHHQIPITRFSRCIAIAIATEGSESSNHFSQGVSDSLVLTPSLYLTARCWAKSIVSSAVVLLRPSKSCYFSPRPIFGAFGEFSLNCNCQASLFCSVCLSVFSCFPLQNLGIAKESFPPETRTETTF